MIVLLTIHCERDSHVKKYAPTYVIHNCSHNMVDKQRVDRRTLLYTLNNEFYSSLANLKQHSSIENIKALFFLTSFETYFTYTCSTEQFTVCFARTTDETPQRCSWNSLVNFKSKPLCSRVSMNSS